MTVRALRIAAGVELASLAVLLTNLATVHWPAVSSLIGPTHGCAYLLVVICAARVREASTRTRVTAAIPGIGGLLAVRQLSGATTFRRNSGRTPQENC